MQSVLDKSGHRCYGGEGEFFKRIQMFAGGLAIYYCRRKRIFGGPDRASLVNLW